MDSKDGALKSRKLWFAIGTSVVIFLGGMMAAKWAAFAPMYETVVGGLLGSLGLYLTGNLGGKYVIGRVSRQRYNDRLRNYQDEGQPIEQEPPE